MFTKFWLKIDCPHHILAPLTPPPTSGWVRLTNKDIQTELVF